MPINVIIRRNDLVEFTSRVKSPGGSPGGSQRSLRDFPFEKQNGSPAVRFSRTLFSIRIFETDRFEPGDRKGPIDRTASSGRLQPLEDRLSGEEPRPRCPLR